MIHGSWNMSVTSIGRRECCDKVVKADSSTLQSIHDWFVTQQQMDVWYDDNYCYHDDDIIEWYEGYKKRIIQKAKIKEELVSIA